MTSQSCFSYTYINKICMQCIRKMDEKGQTSPVKDKIAFLLFSSLKSPFLPHATYSYPPDYFIFFIAAKTSQFTACLCLA